MSLHSKSTPHKPSKSNFQKGGHCLLWPDRTQAELERLRIASEGIPPIPPRWRRIAPAQYLKDRLTSYRNKFVMLP
jgi:hypothetical protein